MIWWPRLIAALAFCTTAACARPAPSVAGAGARSGSAEADIRTLLQEMADAWNRADLDAHVAPYADSATFMGGSGPMRGRAQTQASLRRSFWRDGRPLQALQFGQIAVELLGSDHALVTGRFVLAGGERPERSGWFTLLWARTAQGWRIVHDHSS